MGRDGSVDWLCMRRIDAPSTFGRLLGPEAGHWTLGPVGDAGAVRTTRRYLERSLVLETTHETADGTVVVTEALVIPQDDDPHALGLQVPHVLARLVRCTAGRVRITSELAPRPEYGIIVPVLEAGEDGCLHLVGGADGFVFGGTDAWQVDAGTARLELELAAGEEVGLSMQWHRAWDDAPTAWTTEDVRREIEATVAAWQGWDDEHADYDGPWGDLVSVSGRVLHGLSYAPTSATVAAATTSLPEAPGAGRTWDYRFAWLRDAGLTMRALSIATCPDEAADFFGWAVRATSDDSPGSVQVVYGVEGERALHEHELHHLPGWRDTGPVRIGNAAWLQRQLDVYGELLDAAWLLREHAGPYEGTVARFLVQLTDEACELWRKPDSGVWEMPDVELHFVSSKVFCWVALDRACRLVEAGVLEADDETTARWRSTADEVLAEIEARGWNERVGAYTQAFDSDELDASVLLVVLYDLPLRDATRVRRTVETIERGLTRGGLLDRYTTDDGLPGREGAFLLCSFWLAEAWAKLGEVARATEVFERTAALVNDLGLLAEQADPDSRELLGNFPQAFSHTGLVNAASAIGAASTSRSEEEQHE
ncbi:MAG: glycoside hydrolase family 15 [Thermoleophilia bacterium]|nr:glycoside hydrolase family 15 [Thermoleophilia bacterium]